MFLSMTYVFDYKKIRQVIEDRGLKQTWVAERIGIRNNTLNGYLNGRGYPRSATRKLLSEVLNIPEKEFMRIE